MPLPRASNLSRCDGPQPAALRTAGSMLVQCRRCCRSDGLPTHVAMHARRSTVPQTVPSTSGVHPLAAPPPHICARIAALVRALPPAAEWATVHHDAGNRRRACVCVGRACVSVWVHAFTCTSGVNVRSTACARVSVCVCACVCVFVKREGGGRFSVSNCVCACLCLCLSVCVCAWDTHVWVL